MKRVALIISKQLKAHAKIRKMRQIKVKKTFMMHKGYIKSNETFEMRKKNKLRNRKII